MARGAEHEPRARAGAGQRSFQPSLVVGGRPADHRGVVEQLRPHRTVRERARARHQEVLLVEELDVLDVAFDVTVVEHQVEIPDPRVLRPHVGQPDVAAWMGVQQPADDDRQDQGGHALEGADVDPAVARLEAVDGVGQRLRSPQQLATVGQDHLAQRRDPDGFRPAGPVEDRAADSLLERRDLLAHRRLGVAEPGRRLAERSFLGDHGHGPQVPQFDVRHEAEHKR